MNKQYFTSEQVTSGEFNDFLAVLMKQCYGVSEFYNDIRIIPVDCGAFEIQWGSRAWESALDYDQGFVWLSEEDLVMQEKLMPDKTTVFVHNNDEYNEILTTWLAEHPTWKKNILTGRWENSADLVI